MHNILGGKAMIFIKVKTSAQDIIGLDPDDFKEKAREIMLEFITPQPLICEV
jgi:hypothetical protein